MALPGKCIFSHMGSVLCKQPVSWDGLNRPRNRRDDKNGYEGLTESTSGGCAVAAGAGSILPCPGPASAQHVCKGPSALRCTSSEHENEDPVVLTI